MAGSRAIRAGAAYVELYGEDGRLQRTMSRVRREFRAFRASAVAVGAAATAAFAAVTGAVAAVAASSIRAASEANEIRNRFGAVFRDEADAAGRFADELAASTGRSATILRGALSDFQGFFVGLGFGAGEARELSQRLTELAIDFGSFNNLSDDEAIGRFISALSGSSEVVDRFGINLKMAALEQELMASGLAKSAAAAGETEKALARVAIISRAMTDQGAVGDAVRTSGAWANQTRRLSSEFFELRAAVGNLLIPVLLPYLSALAGGVQATRQFVQSLGRVRDAMVFFFDDADRSSLVGAVDEFAEALAGGELEAAADIAKNVLLVMAAEAGAGIEKAMKRTIANVVAAWLDMIPDIGGAFGAARSALLGATLMNEGEIDREVDQAVAALDAARRRYEDTIRAGGAGGPGGPGEAARARAAAGFSVGSLSAFGALQALRAGPDDQLLNKVDRVASIASRIERNTANGATFT